MSQRDEIVLLTRELATGIAPTHYSYSEAKVPPTFITIIVISVMTIGILGNGLVVKVYLTSKHMRSPSNLFIVNLALGDLTFLFSSTTTVNTVMHDGQMLYGQRGCVILAFLIVTSAISSLTTMGLIAISRYMAIVHPHRKQYLSQRVCICLCVFTWLYGSILLIPTFIGRGFLGYNRLEWACTFDWSINMAYNIILFCATQVLTSVIMCFCYSSIIWVFRRSKRRVADQTGTTRQNVLNKDEFRLCIQLIVIFSIYNLCWGPYFLLVVMLDVEFAPWAYGLSGILVFLNSSVNVLVYLYFNKQFRTECLKSIGIQTVTTSFNS